MISKFNGTCRYCEKPTLAGKDQYDLDDKTAFHQACFDNPPIPPELHEWAESIGFLTQQDAEQKDWTRTEE